MARFGQLVRVNSELLEDPQFDAGEFLRTNFELAMQRNGVAPVGEIRVGEWHQVFDLEGVPIGQMEAAISAETVPA